jgi:hypothetical protein
VAPAVTALAIVYGAAAFLGFAFALPARSATLSNPVDAAGAYTPYVLSTVLGGVVAVYLQAIAIAELRGAPMTVAWLRLVGPPALAANLLLATAFLPWDLATRDPGVLRSPAAIVLLVAEFAGTYLLFRITFWAMAILDGAGLREGLAISWRLSRRSVLRILGWAIVLGVPSVALLLLGSRVRPGLLNGPLAVAARQFVLSAWTVVTTGGVVVLYQSQKWRAAAPRPRRAMLIDELAARDN